MNLELARFTASMIKIFKREGKVIGGWWGKDLIGFQVLAQVVGYGCWLLPKPMYNVTDKQVDHSPSSLFFFLFLFSFYINGAVAGITERSIVSLNDPTGSPLAYGPPFLNLDRSLYGPFF